MDETLLDKLPLGDKQHVYIEEHWTQDERDKLIEDIAKLGAELRRISVFTRSYHEAGDLKVVRGGIALALLELQKVLMPIYGADALWALEQALDTFNEAHKGNRHWLVTFKKDEPHLPQTAPYREVRKALAAAALEYFDEFQADLEMNQSTIAARIAEAMTAGGFRVRPERKTPLSGRTVQDWRNLLASGKRPKRKKRNPYVIDACNGFVDLLKSGRGQKSGLQYFNEVLIDITMRCRDHTEVFPRDLTSANAKLRD